VSGRDVASRRAAASGTEMRGEGGRRSGRAHRRRETALHVCQGGAARRDATRRGGGEDGRVKEEGRDLGENG
jgi:hypothetical protein